MRSCAIGIAVLATALDVDLVLDASAPAR